MKKSLLMIALTGIFGAAHAQIITEAMVNPPSTDDEKEFVELRGPANSTVAGLTLLVIEGDGGASGVVDQVINLGSVAFGANGLLLIKSNLQASNPFLPTIDPGTANHSVNWVNVGGNTGIENGTQTLVLGIATAPIAQGLDIDSANNGTITPIAGFTAIDAISFTESGSGVENPYAADFGYFDTPQQSSWTGDAVYRVFNAGGSTLGWALVEIDAASGAFGPWNLSATLGDYSNIAPATGTDIVNLNPGNANLVFSAAPTFNGTITLNSSDADWSNEQVSFEFVQNGNTVATVSGVQLSASGAYSFNAPVAVTPGSYDIRVKGDTWLSRLASSVTVANGANAFDLTLTRNGDVNGDNEVGAADFSQLAAAYDSVAGDVNFDALADVNDDGEVGAADFSIIAANYDEVGE